MLLRRLVLENFGVFRDRNELELTPRVRYRQRRPVVLIGGKNGSGKTTLLEALRLCLYGPLALGSRVSAREFDTYLADRIHRAEGDLLQPFSAAVGLEFEYAQAGIQHSYCVERRWEKQQESLTHNLSILRDGKALDELDRAHADDFLRDLIPPGVSQLFFFDGEKIQQLAETAQDHLALANATRDLIGLELLERLQGDLRVYASRVKDSGTACPLEAEQTCLTQERQALEQQRRELMIQLDRCQAHLDRMRQDVAREELRLAREGGGFASQREALRVEKDQLHKAVAEAEAEIRELCEGLLPFTLAASQCRALRKQLEAEKKVLSWNVQQNAIQGRLKGIEKRIEMALFTGLEKEQIGQTVRKKIMRRVVALLDQLVKAPADLPELCLVHRTSEEEFGRLLGAIDKVLLDLPRQLTTAQKRLERSIRRLQEVEAALGKIPKDEVLQPVLESIRDLNRELGKAQAAVDRAELDVREIDLKLEDNSRRGKKIQEKTANLQRVTNRGALVAKVQTALDDYARLLTTSKIDELREALTRRFAQLWRKGDLVRRIEIDPKDFRVTLFDRRERPVPKQELSAGEKQIYAISILWALGQVSGRPLPMVIDTPLGRLDTDHRGHLVERYFPHASHQVIILSTDTEIDQAYFRALGASISHSYHLQYDVIESKCVVEKGYFWSGQEVEVADAAK